MYNIKLIKLSNVITRTCHFCCFLQRDHWQLPPRSKIM